MAGDDGDLRSPQPIDHAAAKPPTSAKELLARYAAGERDFASTNLRGADLTEARFRRAVFERADFRDATGPFLVGLPARISAALMVCRR